MVTYKTPGVYVTEVSAFPASVIPVETAIPAFIGYTASALDSRGQSTHLIPTLITSLLEFEVIFGGAPPTRVTHWLDSQNNVVASELENRYCLYDSLRLFFANGGGQCLIVSVGDYSKGIYVSELEEGLNALTQNTMATLIVMPEAAVTASVHTLEAQALAHCANQANRFALFDLRLKTTEKDLLAEARRLREAVGAQHLKYGAAYGPWLMTTWPRTIYLSQLVFRAQLDGHIISPDNLATDAEMRKLVREIHQSEQAPETLDSKTKLNQLHQTLYKTYAMAKQWRDAAISALNTLPSSGAVAGVYSAMDQNRGIWKAPANVSLNMVQAPLVKVNDAQQKNYAIDMTAGKSINLIRAFAGKGTLVWGARTLAGNDNEWRYINIRRFCSWVETSVSQSLQPVVFEPNDANTWVRVQTMIANFLTLLWRQGALQGSKPEHGFFVQVGLGKTMTVNDITQGLMLIEIGLAVVKPAEFIVLKLKLQHF